MTAARTAVLAIVATVLAIAAWVPAAHAARRKPTIEFRPVLAQLAPAVPTTTSTAPLDLAGAKTTVASCDVAAVRRLPVIPTTPAATATSSACVVFPDERGGRDAPRYYLGPAGDLPVATATSEFQSGQGWTVRIGFTRGAAKAWDRLTEQQFHQQVAVTYQGIVVSAPTIQPNDQRFRSFGGEAVISGSFSQKEAAALARAARLANRR